MENKKFLSLLHTQIYIPILVSRMETWIFSSVYGMELGNFSSLRNGTRKLLRITEWNFSSFSNETRNFFWNTE